MRRALHLIVVLLTLAGVALGAFQLAQHSWDQVAEYQSPFIGALPSPPLAGGAMGKRVLPGG